MTRTITLVLVLAQIALSVSKSPVVQLPNGKILGRVATTIEGNSFYAFEKVPYAAPPVGNLRFKPPQSPTNWEGTLNTTYLDIACYQITRRAAIESEDCLFLNVYAPKVPTRKNGLPVMVYIHGGGYAMGWSRYAQPDLFIDQNVILVTVNYRLGVFGFTSTGDSVIPGNTGLKDQLFALKWVHNNINLFGGDPKRVTIFGQSAGGGSCAYQLLNPKAQGLFGGAILQSGTCLSLANFQRDARKVAFGTAAVLNSTFQTSDDSEQLYKFLVNVEAGDLNAAAEQYTKDQSHDYDRLLNPGTLWAPVIEVENCDSFITEKMYKLLKTGNVLKVPTMIGIASEEGLAAYDDPATLKSALEVFDDNLDYIVPGDMQINDDLENRTKMGQLIRKIYTEGEPFADHLGAGIRYCSDNGLTRPMIKHAELFSRFAPTYFYQFSYDGALGGIDIHWGDGAGNVSHAEELKYLFCSGAECAISSYPKSDLLTRQRLIKLWTDFAKYRNPIPESTELLQNVAWPELNTEDGNFLYLDINENLAVKNHPKESYKGWTQLYDSLEFDDFDTY